MGKTSSDEWPTRVKGVIVDVLDLGIDPGELADDLSLYSSTLKMDSMTLLHLLVTFESEFGFELDDEDVMNANLDTVRSLVDLVVDVAEGGRGAVAAGPANDGLGG
ncbi:acyl carrier protein [Streptomyces viridosporus]|uniref:acyl carrier protein n=1 Tax=Streptomyces viridosporus TaxID=67581 RepID=UPI0036FE4D93